MAKVFVLCSGVSRAIAYAKQWGNCEGVFSSFLAFEQFAKKQGISIVPEAIESRHQAIAMWQDGNGRFWAVFEEEIHGVD